MSDAELLAEMRLLRPDGKIFGGADALLEIAREFWCLWPIRLLAQFTFIERLLHASYRWVARHRHCAGGTCQLDAAQKAPATLRKTNRLLDYLPLLILPLLALTLRPQLPAWVFMWAMAFALYAGCKWLTYRIASRTSLAVHPAMKLGYLFAWPGMKGTQFFDRKERVAKPGMTEWAYAIGKIIFGWFLLYSVTRVALPAHPLLGGWLGMTGIVFILHFGIFHLLSLAWRSRGVNAMPIMKNPLMAETIANFWGVRWNTAFHELAFRFIFRPACRRTQPDAAMLAVFGLSGAIHELVISLPARGGYGLPFLYFLIQGLGVIFERNWLPPGTNFRANFYKRLFALVIIIAPAPWLFHPPFIHNVILPMLTAIGAT